jgi:hypothetical protein
MGNRKPYVCDPAGCREAARLGPRRRRRPVGAVRSCAAASLLAAAPLCAQKTDVVVMVNGDAITGEIKGLERGKLDYNTDDVGRLSIKWIKVVRITSRHYFEVEVSSGRKYFGQLLPAESDGRVVVGLAEQQDTIAIGRIVRMFPIEADFFSRVRAYLDAGLSLAKANRNLTLNVNAQASYRGPRWGTGLKYAGYLQRQRDTSATTSNTLTLSGTRYLTHRWDVALLAQIEQNDELNLVARYTGGALGARRFVQTNSHEVRGAIGAVVTSEHFATADTSALSADTIKANLEGLVGFEWAWFRFDTPKLDIGTSALAYPSISQLGRFRGDGKLRIKYEIFKDFHVGLNFSLTFDSRPPDTSAAKTDYQSSVTVGWSYRR